MNGLKTITDTHVLLIALVTKPSVTRLVRLYAGPKIINVFIEKMAKKVKSVKLLKHIFL